MPSHDYVGAFYFLFRGNPHHVGTEEGGSLPHRGEGTAWVDSMRGHLYGDVPIGTYPLLGDQTAWGCVDFDEGDEESLVHARNLETVLDQFGIIGWIERSRSKGYHVWVFPTEPVPAVLMREALLGACQVVDAPTKEINPKQVESVDGKIGNYVRLPYPSGWGINKRRCMIDYEGDPISMEDFVDAAHTDRCTVEQLTKLRALYRPPTRKYVPPVSEHKFAGEGSAERRMSGLAFKIWKDGPLGEDRSDTLWKLANQLREDGKHTFAEALELVTDADSRWGKFVERGDPDELERMLNKAWK